MDQLRQFFCGVIQNPRTSAAGVAMIIGGIGMLRVREYEAGAFAIITGIGFLVSPDATNVKRK